MLGLPPGITPSIDDIKKRYKSLAFQYHPDKNPDDPDKLARFMEISYAYEMLTNPQFRITEARTGGADLNVVSNLMIPFEDAFFGKRLSLFATVVAPTFHPGTDPDESVAELKIEPLIVEVPPGTLTRDYIFAGQGYDRGGVRGDFILTVVAQAHPLFKMDQQGNVLTEVHIPLRIMLRGGTFDVQTLYGIRSLQVPPGTQPRDQIRMPGLGVSRRGHQAVTVLPEFPSKDELKTHQDWRQIGIDWTPKAQVNDQEIEALRGMFVDKLK